MSNVNEEAIALHKKFRGKLEVVSKVPLKSNYDLTLALYSRRCRSLP